MSAPTPPGTDRNLLFGVLALQMDFIDREALVRAMHAWVLDKHKALAQLLVEQGGLAAEHRNLLEPLVEAHLRAHGGDPQRSLAALGSVRSVREDLSRLADAEVQASLAHLAATPPAQGRRYAAALAALTALLLVGLVTVGLAAVRAEQQRTAAERDRAEENAALAERQRGRAEAVNKFLLDDLLAEAAPEKNPRQKQVTVEEVLDKAAAKADMAFAGQPETEGDVRYAIGSTYYQLGKYERARPHLEWAVALRSERLGPDHPDTLEAQENLAVVLMQLGELAAAEPLFQQCLEARRRVLGPDHPQTLTAVNNLANLLSAQGKLAEAEPLLRQCLEGRRRVQGPDHPLTLTALGNLAILLLRQGKLAEAEPLFRQNLDALRRRLGPDHPDTLLSLNYLASVLQDQGKRAEAEGLVREALTRARAKLPAGHPTLTESLTQLGAILTDSGRAGEAEPLLREALEQRRKGLPAGQPKTALMESLLGACLAAQQKYAEAEPLLLTGYQVLVKDPGTPEAERQKARQRLVQLYEAWGKPSEAARWRTAKP
jgi:tetratricopeptide (TPR) repeat protein